MTFRCYRSPEAAERARNLLLRDVPQAAVDITDENSLVVWCYPESLAPAQRDLVSPHDVRRPLAPSPATPLFARSGPRRPRSEWSPSDVAAPAAVCADVFERYRIAGDLDNRTAALAEAVAAGVNPNTAKTYYSRYRERMGLPKSVQAVRRVLRDRSRVSLSAKRPEGRKVCNGEAEPAPGTIRREVWDMSDILHRNLRRVPKPSEVAARLPGLSIHSVRKYRQEWHTFHAL